VVFVHLTSLSRYSLVEKKLIRPLVCVHIWLHELHDLEYLALILESNIDILKMYQHTIDEVYKSRYSKVAAKTDTTHHT